MQKKLITQQGFKKFVDEFNTLLKVEKPHWVKEKEIAAAFGDRSENAEYISAKEMIRNIDKRLRFLDKLINEADVINTDELPHDRVNFGSQVVVADMDTLEEKTFIIVGTFETNPSQNKISNVSPLGKALLGKKVTDEIEFSINGMTSYYEVVSIGKHEN